MPPVVFHPWVVVEELRRPVVVLARLFVVAPAYAWVEVAALFLCVNIPYEAALASASGACELLFAASCKPRVFKLVSILIVNHFYFMFKW